MSPKQFKCWFNTDPSGLGLISATWFFLAFACFVTNYFLIWYWWGGQNSYFSDIPLTNSGLGLFLIYHFLLCMTYISHWAAIFSHPGVVTEFKTEDSVRWCKKCQIHKPDRAHHCKTCDRCIFRMDHHCPWINNCVGYRNQRLFILFLCYVATLSIFTLVLIAYVCYLYIRADKSQTYSVVGVICGILLVVESAFFVFFVGDFLSEQIESIETNSTLVETYQHKRGRRIGLKAQLEEVMGKQKYMWWIPVPNWQPPELNEPVYTDENTQFEEEYTEEDLVEEVGILPDDPVEESSSQAGSSEFEASQTGETIEDMIEMRKLRERKNAEGSKPEGEE